MLDVVGASAPSLALTVTTASRDARSSFRTGAVAQPVDGAELLDEMADALRRYVVMSEHQRVAIALWIVHAYLLDRCMISPRLAVRSPVKGCGKTTLLDVLARLVPRLGDRQRHPDRNLPRHRRASADAADR